MTTLPGGTVTFVYTDIEGSTRLLQELGDEGYGRVSGEHRRLVRESFGARGGTEIDTQGDSFFFSFPRARDAVAAAVDAQRALRDHSWPGDVEVRVRMGLHTGGQNIVSETTRALLGNQLPDGVQVHDLGEQNLKDIQHEHVYELSIDGAPAGTKPLNTAGTLDSRLDDRIEAYVEQQLERGFSGDVSPSRAVFGGLAVLGVLLAFFLILLVALKLIFF